MKIDLTVVEASFQAGQYAARNKDGVTLCGVNLNKQGAALLPAGTYVKEGIIALLEVVELSPHMTRKGHLVYLGKVMGSGKGEVILTINYLKSDSDLTCFEQVEDFVFDPDMGEEEPSSSTTSVEGRLLALLGK